MDRAAFLNKIKAKVLQEDENASVILFGSRARGDYREDSDWDFLVLTNKKDDYQLKNKIWDELYEVELEYSQPLSTVIVNKDKWKSLSITPLFKNIALEGKIV
jgi:predicted nucleotidyltransferase